MLTKCRPFMAILHTKTQLKPLLGKLSVLQWHMFTQYIVASYPGLPLLWEKEGHFCNNYYPDNLFFPGKGSTAREEGLGTRLGI